MLFQCWANIETTLGQVLVFAGIAACGFTATDVGPGIHPTFCHELAFSFPADLFLTRLVIVGQYWIDGAAGVGGLCLDSSAM